MRARRFRLLAWALGLAVVAGAVVSGWVFGPNALKPALVSAVERATGRRLQIGGRIALSLAPGFSVRDVTLANAPGLSAEPMLRVDRIEARIDARALLAGRVEVVSLRVERPALLLEADATGADNWHFAPPPRPAGATPATVRAREQVRFRARRVVVADGSVRYRDPWRSAAFGVVGEGAPGQEGVAFAVTLTADGAQAAAVRGELRTARTERPAVSGSLDTKLLDVGVLLAQFRKTAAVPAVATVPSAPSPAVVGPVAPPAPRMLIPDTALPFAALRVADVDLALRIDELRTPHLAARDVAAHLVLRDGQLSLDGGTAGLGDGRLQFSAAFGPQGTALRARAAGVAPAAFGVTDVAGRLDADIDLAGTGATPRALAASAAGHVAVTMGEGTIADRAVSDLAALLLRGMALPEGVAGGDTRLRCLAVRVDAGAGVGRIATLLLDTSRLRVEGGGTLRAADEALDVQLLPTLRIGGPGWALPVHVGGSLGAPKLALRGFPRSAGEADPCPAALAAAAIAP
ncbi:MAG: AsmA family protein [Acidisphaera sp.]|nr:AsmA family protein [Acidisphaera sp.]MBV9812545.1 AsmA family protein [Acetobacteraceae bacterium]